MRWILILILCHAVPGLACRNDLADAASGFVVEVTRDEISHRQNGWHVPLGALSAQGILTKTETLSVFPSQLEGTAYDSPEQFLAKISRYNRYVQGTAMLQMLLRLSHWLGEDWHVDPAEIFLAFTSRRPVILYRAGPKRFELYSRIGPGAKPIQLSGADFFAGHSLSLFPSFSALDYETSKSESNAPFTEAIIGRMFFTGLSAQYKHSREGRRLDGQVSARFQRDAGQLGRIRGLTKMPDMVTAEWESPPMISGPSPHFVSIHSKTRSRHTILIPAFFRPARGPDPRHHVAVMEVDGREAGGLYAISETTATRFREMFNAYLEVMYFHFESSGVLALAQHATRPIRTPFNPNEN